jgi:hypothetical protein
VPSISNILKPIRSYPGTGIASYILLVYMARLPYCITRYVSPANTRNVTIVPNTPNNKMYPIFAKNLLLLILNPAAKIIGGRQT